MGGDFQIPLIMGPLQIATGEMLLQDEDAPDISTDKEQRGYGDALRCQDARCCILNYAKTITSNAT